MNGRQQGTLILLVAIVTIAFLALLWQFYGAVLWGTVLAILFHPFYSKLTTWMGGSAAAIATILAVVLIVILPLSIIAVALVDQSAGLYEILQDRAPGTEHSVAPGTDLLPGWIKTTMARFGIEDVAVIQEVIFNAVLKSGEYLTRKIVTIGQSTFQLVINFFIMTYLLFFMLRNGIGLLGAIQNTIPVHPAQLAMLFETFSSVVKATIKGGFLIAVLQGSLGGLIFWFLGIQAPLLWAVVMAMSSLLPTIGSALIWMPVALYLLVSGSVREGMALIAFGTFVIGLVDNLVRPALVGRETRMPDYLVLISTLGGIELFGPNGFVLGPLIAAAFITLWQIFSQSASSQPEMSD